MIVVVHAGEEPPARWVASLFLAGPTPPSDALAEIHRQWTGPGLLVVFVPEPRGVARPWELYWADRCDIVLLWNPRDDEWDRWKDTGRAVRGSTLPDAVTAALAAVGPGADRSGGHRHVPLMLWRTDSFTRWLRAQTEAGNELRAARLEWTFRINGQVFFWALHVEMYVAAENRIKDEEVVLSRPDIASVLAYRRGETLLDTKIVLIREFRSASTSPDGFVLELPGGSHLDPLSPLKLAASEFAEETGLTVSPDRLVPHGSRQLAATMTAHHQFLFSIELTDAELTQLRPIHAGTEITYPQVHRLADLIANPHADWTTLGAITQVLLG